MPLQSIMVGFFQRLGSKKDGCAEKEAARDALHVFLEKNSKSGKKTRFFKFKSVSRSSTKYFQVDDAKALESKCVHLLLCLTLRKLLCLV